MILLTGATGFLGKHIHTELNKYDKVLTLGRTNCDIACDLGSKVPDGLPVCTIVVHAAGKAHSVPKTDAEKAEFQKVNVKGTSNLLKALEGLPVMPKSFVFISSVAVYGVETGDLISETAPLNAMDAYGRSKIDAEQMIMRWCQTNNIICSILRLPLIAGPNPPGNLHSMINGIKKGFYFNIDGGKAKKSIVLAEDVAKLVPNVAAIGGVYNLTDRQNPTFRQLSFIIANQVGGVKVKNMPFWFAKVLASVGDVIGKRFPINSKTLAKIISNLTFDDSKAVEKLGWNPTSVLVAFKIV